MNDLKFGPWHGIVSDVPGYAKRFIVRRVATLHGSMVTLYERYRDTRGAIIRYATLESAQRRADSLNAQFSSSPNDTDSRSR